MSSQELGGENGRCPSSGGQFQELVDELNVTPNISSTSHPPNLPLPQYVNRLITLNDSPRLLEFSEPLLGVHPAFDRSVVLLQNVVQVLYGSMPATAAEYPFLLYGGMAEPQIDDRSAVVPVWANSAVPSATRSYVQLPLRVPPAVPPPPGVTTNTAGTSAPRT